MIIKKCFPYKYICVFSFFFFFLLISKIKDMVYVYIR